MSKQLCIDESVFLSAIRDLPLSKMKALLEFMALVDAGLLDPANVEDCKATLQRLAYINDHQEQLLAILQLDPKGA